MNGSPAGSGFQNLAMTGSGGGAGGGSGSSQASAEGIRHWMSQPDMSSALRPAFYPRLDPGAFAAAGSHLYSHDAAARLLQMNAAAVSTASSVAGAGAGVGTTGGLLPPFPHHHPSQILSNPFSPYSPLSPSGYAQAAAAAGMAASFGGTRPAYLDPTAFLSGSLPRYRYLLPSSSAMVGRFPPLSTQLDRPHSESESLRWRRPAGGSPKSAVPPNPVFAPVAQDAAITARLKAPDGTGLRPSAGSTDVPMTAADSGGTAAVLPTQPYYPSHFMRGTVIQLASGELKRVEDLNTEDFVRSAGLSNELKMDSSTVVKVEEKTKDTVLLCFLVGEHKVQVSVEATVEHPFFVIGQGWSSCSPERTRTLYGLPCQRLQVGDICISLTHRDVKQQLPSSAAPQSCVAGALQPHLAAGGGPRPSLLAKQQVALSSAVSGSERQELTGRRSLPSASAISSSSAHLSANSKDTDRRRWSYS